MFCFIFIINILVATSISLNIPSSIAFIKDSTITLSKASSASHMCRNNVFPSTSSFQKLISIRGGNSNVIHINSAEQFDNLVSSSDGKLIVLDFTATWCNPCKQIAPFFDQMSASQEFESVIFVKIDVDEVGQLSERFKISAMPTFVFLKGAKEMDRFSGASIEKLKQTIVTHKERNN